MSWPFFNMLFSVSVPLSLSLSHSLFLLFSIRVFVRARQRGHEHLKIDRAILICIKGQHLLLDRLALFTKTNFQFKFFMNIFKIHRRRRSPARQICFKKIFTRHLSVPHLFAAVSSVPSWSSLVEGDEGLYRLKW